MESIAERQDLVIIADAGAVAAASGIDVEHFRDSGEKLLDPDLARQQALAAIAFQPGGNNLSAVIAKTGPFVVTVESRSDARPGA